MEGREGWPGSQSLHSILCRSPEASVRVLCACLVGFFPLRICVNAIHIDVIRIFGRFLWVTMAYRLRQQAAQSSQAAPASGRHNTLSPRRPKGEFSVYRAAPRRYPFRCNLSSLREGIWVLAPFYRQVASQALSEVTWLERLLRYLVQSRDSGVYSLCGQVQLPPYPGPLPLHV